MIANRSIAHGLCLDDGKPARLLALLLTAHVIAWTLYGTVGLAGGVHEDMLEAWVWGKELQPGYFKHPPVFAWVAGAWFRVFPIADWSFYLLAALNSALGLWAVWLLAGLFVEGPRRLAAVFIAMLTPLYGALALKFNANSVLLASWPLAAWFFVRSLRERRPGDSIGLGLSCALAVLSKYYSVLLLVAFAVVALTHPARRAYWRSRAPYLAAAVGLLAVAPHLMWLVQTDGQTFTYAGTKFGFDAAKTLQWAAVTALAPVLFFSAPIVLLIGLKRERWVAAAASFHAWARDPGHSRLGLIAFAPFLLTLLWGLGAVKVSIAYTIPIFFLVPILIVLALPDLFQPHVIRRLGVAAGIVMGVVALASPLLGYVRFATDTRAAIEPRAEVARELTREWRARFKRPLQLVAGSTAYASSIPFYSADHPSQFINFAFATAPWVTPERLAREGLLVVCEDADPTGCLDQLAQRTTSRSIRLDRSFARSAYGRTAPPVALKILLVPPAE